MKNLPQKIVLIIIGVMLVAIFGSQLSKSENTVQPTQEPTTTQMEDAVMEQESGMKQDSMEVEAVTYQATAEGENAFELLKENADVEFEQYDFGVFVSSINGVSGNNEYFWSLYVNGEQSMTGADQTILNEGDLVEWRYEKVQ